MKHFVIDFKKPELKKFKDEYAAIKEKVLKADPDLATDPNVRFIDSKKRIEIDYCYKDLLNRHPNLKSTVLRDIGEQILPNGPSGFQNEDMYAVFGTEEGKAARKDFVLNARKELRGERYQDAPELPEPNGKADNTTNFKTMLEASEKGLCFGATHNDKTRDGLLQEMLAQDDHGGLDMFFIEELGIIDQPDVDDFIVSGKNGQMSKYLAAKIKSYPMVIKMLEFARDYNDGRPSGEHIKVFGIDSGQAEMQEGVLEYESRAAGMNQVARDVMRKATGDFPDKKFLAYCGAAHSNTHAGGVPGLSQMFGIPAIKIADDSPVIIVDRENKALRNMPSAEEIETIEKLQDKKKVFGDVAEKNKEAIKLGDTARVETCKKALSEVERLQKLIEAEKAPVKKKGSKTTKATGKGGSNAKGKQWEKELLKADGESKRLIADYVKKYPQILKSKDADNKPLSQIAAEKGSTDLSASLAKLEQESFAAELDARAEKKAAADLKNDPNFGEMSEGDKASKLQELLGQARFEEAKTSLLQPYLTLRKNITESEQMHAASLSGGQNTQELVLQHQKKIKGLNDKLNESRADMARLLPAYLKKYPDILKLKDPENRTLLHIAAVQGNADVMASIADKEKSLIDKQDDRGNTAAHYVLERRDFLDEDLRQDQLKAQASGLNKLITRGAKLDLQNNEKQTPLHLAALTGNSKAADDLIKGGAKVTLKDNRDWTAFDVCLGSTKPAVEKVFYDNGKASPKFVPEKPKQSVVDILVQVTKCEDAKQADGIKEMYEKLYADENLRPILEAAAVDAMQDRDPPKEGGTRIFVADANSTGRLYAAPTWYPGGEGGYDPNANSFVLAGKPDQDKDCREGVLIHEMTHMVTRKMFGADTVPYDNDKDKKAYTDAILKDVRTMHLMNTSDPAEKRIKDRISDRMKTYANRSGDDELLQEFIVGIPQLIAEHGADVVEAYAPNLMRIYKEFTAKCRNKMKTDPQYKDLYKTIDNTELDKKLKENPPTLPKTSLTWLDNKSDDLKADVLMAKIKAEHSVRHGEVKLPTNATIPYSADVYKIKDTDKAAFDKKMAKIQAGLQQALASGSMPPTVDSKGIRSLIMDTVDVADKVKDDNQLEAAITGSISNWVRDSKVRYIERSVDQQLETGKKPDAKAMAEATLLIAEDQALRKLGNGDPNMVVQVNPEKHAEMVRALSKDLEKQLDRLNAKQIKELMGQLAKAMVDSPKSPFSIKKKNVATDPTHVSIDKKELKSVWMKKLKAMPVLTT